MTINRSTKYLSIEAEEGQNIKKNRNSFFKFQTFKNFNSKYVKFYTFHSGFKKKKDDLLIVYFKFLVPVAAVYSKTSTPSAPIIWDKKNNNGYCKLLIVNSGNANAHTGSLGIRNIDKYVKQASVFFDCSVNEILVSSTGVIGEQLDYKKIINKLSLVKNTRERNLLFAAKTIMTTDTFPKFIQKKVKIESGFVNIFGIAKGSGMIFPNMGTMLAYIFIEANISQSVLKKFLKNHLDCSFNSISVDSDTSTSDTVMLFSLASNKETKITNARDIKLISGLLKDVMLNLALQIISDGEGISKLIKVNVTSAKSYNQASIIAFSIANSPLVKTAIAGEDANWGRVIMAIGKSGTIINQNKIKLSFGKFIVAKNGSMSKYINLKKLDSYMKNKIIEINVDLGLSKHNRTVYSSDLTHEYISINADYRRS